MLLSLLHQIFSFYYDHGILTIVFFIDLFMVTNVVVLHYFSYYPLYQCFGSKNLLYFSLIFLFQVIAKHNLLYSSYRVLFRLDIITTFINHACRKIIRKIFSTFHSCVYVCIDNIEQSLLLSGGLWTFIMTLCYWS